MISAQSQHIFDKVLKHPEVIGFNRIGRVYPENPQMVQEAYELIKIGSDNHKNFEKAVMSRLPQAKETRHYWLLRILTNILEDPTYREGSKVEGV